MYHHYKMNIHYEMQYVCYTPSDLDRLISKE